MYWFESKLWHQFMKFHYYYNRIESAKLKKTVLTIKFKKLTKHVDKIICQVPSETTNHKIRPYCVVAGDASKIIIAEGLDTKIATIT